MAVKSVNIISGQSLDKYDVIDQNLLPSKTFIRNFGDTDDYIEAHLYTKDDRLLLSNYNVRDYKIPSTATSDTTLANSLEFDPAKYIQDIGYKVGDFKLEYRILRKKLFTIASPTFFISEISKDRTEIRLTSNTVSDATLEENTLNFLYEIQSSQYFKDFLLNFGDNKLVNAVNIALDKNTNPYSVIVKLYRALPTEFDLKSTLWVVEELADPITFEVELVPDPVVEQVQFLGPANFNVEIDTHKSVGSTYQSLSSIYNTDDIQSYQDVVNKLNTKSAAINVDYTDYQNFVHFSSAQQRLNNFYYKLQTIEGYNNDISILEAVPNYSGSVSVSSSIYTLQQNVNNLVKDMDGYEKFLYSVTSSAAWPKYSGSLLYATDSTEGLTWFGDYNEDSPYYGGQSYTASLYDLENQDNLTNVVPEYLAIDEANSDYLLFVNMLGQQFDEVWLYIKGMNDLYKAENSVSEGISKDMVFTALRSLGIKVYNSNSNQDIFEYLLGNTSGSYTVTGSNATTSGEDISKELFKRIYHNLPYLLKSKGSEGGLKGIISTYGVPDTILSVTEYGGSDKFSDTLEYVTDRFSYGYVCSGSNYVELPWAPLSQNLIKYGQNLYPDSIELRFTPDEDVIKNDVTLLQAYSGSLVNFGVSMHYTSSEGVPSANVMFTLQDVSSSLSLPIYATGSDGQAYWWNMLLKRTTKYTTPNTSSIQVYELSVQNSISGKVAHTASAYLYATGSGNGPRNLAWGSNSTLRVGGYALTGSNFISGSEFLGKLQELRLWSEPLSGSYFNLHTLNNESIAESTSYDNLAARFPLGNSVNLVISESIHPNVSIDYMTGNNVISFTGSVDYESFYEYQYNSTNLGPVTDKVRIIDNTVEGEVLSPFLKLEKPEQYRTKDSNFTDISFSPQSEIDKDILAQYGTTLNLDEFLGDPRVQYDRNYSRLELLKQAYYKKYISTLNYKDFIKLVDSFDNSLFKMLSDNAPVISNLSTGITVKSPILERNRIKRYQPEVTQNDYTASIAGQTISAGMPHAELTTGFEFYTGKLSGSLINLDENFEENNFNEYALFNQNLDLNKFEHSHFNVLHGNVSRQRLSSKFKKIDPYNDEILTYAELQDSYYTSQAYLNGRYEGAKSTSRYYNVYTPGDTAYGKNPAIYRNVLKFGYVNQGSSNSLNFCDKTSFNLKYLIDPSGSVLELSKQNNNLFEVQNTFKSGDSVTVSVTDPLNPTNQSVLGGPKTIYEGGYSYSPIIYREINETLTFNYLNPSSTTTSRLGIKAVSKKFIAWEKHDPLSYEFNQPDSSNGIVIFKIDGVANTTQGLSLTQYDNNNNWLYPGQIPVAFSGDVLNWNGTVNSYTSPVSDKANTYWFALDWFLPASTGSADGGYKTSDFNTTLAITDNSSEKYTTFTAPRQSTYSINLNIPITYNADNPRNGASSFKVMGVVEKYNAGNWNYVTKTDLQLVFMPLHDFIKISTSESFIAYDSFGSGDFGSTDMQFNCVLNNYQLALNAGEQIRVRLYFVTIENVFFNSENIKFKISAGTATKGYLEIYDAISSGTSTVDTVTIGTTPQIFTLDTGSFNTLIFNPTASLIYNNSIFSSTGSSVEGKYSPIVDVFQFNQGDLVRFDSYNTVGATLYTINSVTYPVILNSGSVQTVVTPLKVKLDQQVNASIVGSATKFAFIRRNEDETNVTINFKKPAGEVSPVILIPNNLREDVKNNIANIVQPLKGNLLN